MLAFDSLLLRVAGVIYVSIKESRPSNQIWTLYRCSQLFV